LLPGTPFIAKILYDLGYTTGEFGKNHLDDNIAGGPKGDGLKSSSEGL
jgi:arylsulfatase